MGNASARDWDPIIGKRFNPLETVNTHTSLKEKGGSHLVTTLSENWKGYTN